VENIVKNCLYGYKNGEKIEETGQMVKELYYRTDLGWGMYLFETEKDTETGKRTFIVNGVFPKKLKILRFYRISGTVETKKGQKQIKMESFCQILPDKEDDTVSVLKLIESVRDNAYGVYDAIGNGFFKKAQNSPTLFSKKLKEKGITDNQVNDIFKMIEEVNEDRKMSNLISFLNLSTEECRVLFDDYGEKSLFDIGKNPYLLLKNRIRSSFSAVDSIALSCGVKPDSIERMTEAVCYVLDRLAERGHTMKEEKDIIANVTKVTEVKSNGKEKGSFRVGQDNVKDALNLLVLEERIHKVGLGKDIFYQLDMYHKSEDIISKKVTELINGEHKSSLNSEKILKDYLNRKGIELEKRQYEAVERITRNDGGMFILTGPAGSGKTFIIKAIIDILKIKDSGCVISCLAPTGKAAKNISNATSLPASTIHRFVGKIKSGYVEKVCDVYIIDEFSMVDTKVAGWLFCDIPSSSKVIVIGDTNQLPSIGAGSVLKDLIESGAVPHLHLDTIKRQSERSGILINANGIYKGEIPKTEIVNNKGYTNNSYILTPEAVSLSQKTNGVRNKSIRAVVEIAENKGLKAFHEDRIQFLVPSRKAATGTYSINYAVQQAVNPYDGKSERVATGIFVNRQPLYFQEGDKVINTINDYRALWYIKRGSEYILSGKEGIINGETGIIRQIQTVSLYHSEPISRIVVQYGDEYVFYDGKKSDNLLHAYAITIHKSQGSQWKEVCGVLTAEDRTLLDRNILYTLITRAKGTLMIIAEDEVLRMAVDNTKSLNRVCGLKNKLESLVYSCALP